MRQLILQTMLLVICNITFAANIDSLYQVGNGLYSENKFIEALEVYRSVEKTGFHSAELYLNIGNSYYKSGEYPRAILYYERAKLLDPRNEKINFNLAKAKTYIIDNIEEIPEFFLARWLRNFINILTSNQWAMISIISFLLWWTGFLIYFLSGRISYKRSGFYLGVLFFIISALTYFNSFKSKSYQTRSTSAILMTPTVTVKGSPSEEGINVFIIHEGTKVFITDDVFEWYEVKLSDGKQGWLRKETIELI